MDRFNLSAASDYAYRRVHASKEFPTVIEKIKVLRGLQAQAESAANCRTADGPDSEGRERRRYRWRSSARAWC